jgi:hypothetical protein
MEHFLELKNVILSFQVVVCKIKLKKFKGGFGCHKGARDQGVG